MQATLVLLIVSCSVAFAGYGYTTADSSSGSGELSAHNVYSHSPSCIRNVLPSASCGCGPRVVKHCPKVFVKNRRFVVNHPQKVKKVTKKITLHKHVLRRLPKVYKKLVVKHKVRYGLRKVPTCGCGKKVVGYQYGYGHGSASSSEEQPACTSVLHPSGCGCGAASSSEELQNYGTPTCNRCRAASSSEAVY